jgi:hypothetical protein
MLATRGRRMDLLIAGHGAKTVTAVIAGSIIPIARTWWCPPRPLRRKSLCRWAIPLAAGACCAKQAITETLR